MSELNFELLQENIRNLMKKHSITQNELADIAGMSQPNISKALNSAASKQFTIDQIFRIAQHFKVSIDELTGNKEAKKASYTPRAVLAFLIELLATDKARIVSCTKMEEVFNVTYNDYERSCSHDIHEIEYPAIYFPGYLNIQEMRLTESEYHEILSEFMQCGNDSAFCAMNDIIKKIQPMIDLYKKQEIPEEAFRMIVDGYLQKVRDI